MSDTRLRADDGASHPPTAASENATPKGKRGRWERSLEFREKQSHAWARRRGQKLRPHGSGTLDPDFDEGF